MTLGYLRRVRAPEFGHIFSVIVANMCVAIWEPTTITMQVQNSVEKKVCTFSVPNYEFADAKSEFADANYEFADANSEFADVNSEFADANSEFADANSKFPSLQSGT